MPKGTPVVIAASGTAEVVLQILNEQKRWFPKNFSLEIYKGPEGMTIEKMESTPKSLTLTLKASDQVNQNSMPQNLLIEIICKNVPNKNNKNSKKMNTWQIGFLPAIPVLVKSGM